MRPLMIFAAGLGTRMRPLTDTLPKPLIPVGGRTLLDRALDLGHGAGAGPVVVNTHYLGGQIAAHLRNDLANARLVARQSRRADVSVAQPSHQEPGKG